METLVLPGRLIKKASSAKRHYLGRPGGHTCEWDSEQHAVDEASPLFARNLRSSLIHVRKEQRARREESLLL